jgi:hypothetical protein
VNGRPTTLDGLVDDDLRRIAEITLDLAWYRQGGHQELATAAAIELVHATSVLPDYPHGDVVIVAEPRRR